MEYVYPRLQALTLCWKSRCPDLWGNTRGSPNPPEDSKLESCHFQGKHFKNSAFSKLVAQVMTAWNSNLLFYCLLLLLSSVRISEQRSVFMPPVYSAPQPKAMPTCKGWFYRLQHCAAPMSDKQRAVQSCGGLGGGAPGRKRRLDSKGTRKRWWKMRLFFVTLYAWWKYVAFVVRPASFWWITSSLLYVFWRCW